METMTPACFTGFIGLLALLFALFVVASQVSSYRESRRTQDGIQDDGEPRDVEDGITYVVMDASLFPAHLAALGMARIETPAPAIVPVCSVRCPTCELESLSRHGYASHMPRPDCDNWALCERHRRHNHADVVLSETGRWA